MWFTRFWAPPGARLPMALHSSPLLSSTALSWLAQLQRMCSFSCDKLTAISSYPNAKRVVNVTWWEMKKSQLIKVHWNALFFSFSLFVYFFSPLELSARHFVAILCTISWLLCTVYAMKGTCVNLKKKNCFVGYWDAPGKGTLSWSGHAGLPFAQQRASSHSGGVINTTVAPTWNVSFCWSRAMAPLLA